MFIFTAIISAHIFLDEKNNKCLEVLNHIDDDREGLSMFDGYEDEVLSEIDMGESEDYFFIAMIEATPVTHYGHEYTEYDVEFKLKEVKDMQDLKIGC